MNGTSGFSSMLISIHDAIKDADLCGTMSTYSCPNKLRLLLGWLIKLLVACALVMGKGNGALVNKNHLKGVATLQDSLCVLQPHDFVGVSYKLAVSSPL